ncbi:MAG: pyridoxamine 5'-phosphate oxidase family protein [Thiomicrorhabdus sp.]|nr:pyridoxamine 5'-phosphate oxidase family protein [Thiomicrorhabdus sp.]
MTNQQQCQAFWQARRSIILSTVNLEGRLETSITPFISDDDGSLYVFISELAQHTQNILYLLSESSVELDQSSTLISGLLVADESETEQSFARERLTLQLLPSEIFRESGCFSAHLSRFEEAFGEVIPLLASLPDFHLIQLKIIKGGYVKGFGQAFTFEGCPCQGLEPIKRK